MRDDKTHQTPDLDPRAVQLIRQAAEAGKPEAQHQLGLMYANQDGLPLNYAKAADWLQQAAEQQFTPSYALLGWLYANGYGVHQDGAQSAYWYLKSAQAGVASSQYLVASMYRIGSNSLPRDLKAMIHWYQQAAEQHLAPAQNMMGRLMSQGKYLAREPVGAFQWYSLAVANGSEAAKQGLEELVKTMTPEQVTQARQLFLEAMRAQGVDTSILETSQNEDTPGHQL